MIDEILRQECGEACSYNQQLLGARRAEGCSATHLIALDLDQCSLLLQRQDMRKELYAGWLHLET